MEPKALQRLELFAQNAQTVKKEFKWQDAMLKRLAALLYAAEDRVIDLSAMRECHKLIKKSIGLFSSFRGNSAMTVATLLSLRDDPDGLLKNALKVYDMMKQARFRASDYLVVAACQIAAGAAEDKYVETVERARAFYDGMKSDHWFLTGQDDYIFSAMLGLSDVDVSAGVERMERLFQSLRPEFHTGIGVQALTQVLVLGGDGADLETRVLALRDALRSRRMKQLCQAYTLSSLGVLALLPLDTDEIVRQLEENSELLRSKKGFGPWSFVAKQELLLLSAGLVALNSVDQMKRGILDTVLSTSITNIIIAQQAAIAAAAAASASAAASSSSS